MGGYCFLLEPILFGAVFLADLKETRSACRFSDSQAGLVWETVREHWNRVLDSPKKSFCDPPAWWFCAVNKSVLRVPNVSEDRITEWSGLEGTSVGHPAQPPAQAGSPRAGCTGPRPGGA